MVWSSHLATASCTCALSRELDLTQTGLRQTIVTVEDLALKRELTLTHLPWVVLQRSLVP